MPVCLSCEAENPDGYRFCGKCGSSLGSAICVACGASIPGGQPFCGSCGAGQTRSDPIVDSAELGASSSVLEERKLATVLFADVVGFTSLAERTDPELVARIVDAAFRDLGKLVAEHGGTIDKYMGDSVMAVFGVPVAHDDDAERAVAAGLAMRQIGGDLVFSVGINSGEVMSTAVGRGDMTVIGDTVNVAARLEKAAAPGEVLCGRLTAELARERVNFRERQPVLLKGKSEPVEVWEAVSLRAATADDALCGPALVGRHDELAFLFSHWRRATRDHQSQFVVLCGEAGSGKTRLLNELVRAVGDEGLVVRSIYPAYGAMGGARLAAEIVALLGPADEPEVNARVRSAAGEIDESLRSIDPAGVRQEQIWAFGRLLKEKAKDQPLLIVIDDMHRADSRTLELLGELARRLSGLPLLTVLAGRTEPGEWLGHFSSTTTLHLGPLGALDAAVLAEGFVADKPLAPDAARFLVELAGGNPLYLRELVAMARARGMLVDEGDDYKIEAQGGIPATLQALLVSRIDALDPAQKLVLQHTSVLGEGTGEQIAGLGSADAPQVLHSLVDSRLLVQSADGRFQAADSLLREVAYEMLPRNTRGELHRRAAGVSATPEDRARHLERAAKYLTDDESLAGEAAAGLAAAGMEFLHASRHLDAMGMLERAAAMGFHDQVTMLELAKLQAMCGKEEAAFQTLALVPDDPDDPAVAVERDHIAANVRVFTDPGGTLPQLEEAARRWKELGNTSKEAWALANTGVAYFYLSRMQESAEYLERGLELFERIGDRSGAVSASSFLCLARPTDPRIPRWLEESLQFAEESGDRSKKMTALATLTWKNFFNSLTGSSRETAEAEGFAIGLAQLAEELGASDIAIHGWALLAFMERLTGHLDEAREHVNSLQRVTVGVHTYDPWLSWAVSFSVAMAGGASGAAPPFPPDASPDPVVAMAGLVVEIELTLAGRAQEALRRFENVGPPDFGGPLAEVGGVVYALALVLTGDATAALPWLRRAREAAEALDSRSAAISAAALCAEITGDTTGLPPPPPVAESVRDALLLRAYAMNGDESSAEQLRKAASNLAMPGLVAGLASA